MNYTFEEMVKWMTNWHHSVEDSDKSFKIQLWETKPTPYLNDEISYDDIKKINQPVGRPKF